jgi:hypothetical protein
MGTPFHQHLFDDTPLMVQELVLDLVGVSRACTFIRNTLDSLPSHGQEECSRSSGNIDVRGRPVQKKFGSTRSIRDGPHQRRQSEMVLGIWIGTFFQEYLTKSRSVTADE